MHPSNPRKNPQAKRQRYKVRILRSSVSSDIMNRAAMLMGGV